jgi:general secretion pathway protein N
MRRSPLIALALLAAAHVPAQETPAHVEANPLARQPLERFAATRDRPLFSPSRRPPPPAMAHREAEPPPPPPEPPAVVLLGVLTDARGTRAFIRPNPMDKVRSARVGDDISGWKITRIEPTRIIFGQDERSKTFAMFETRRVTTKTARTNAQR